MYFMPRTNRWYSWAVHTKAIYRYGISAFVCVLLIAGWRCGIYVWFNAAIDSERRMLAQLQQQLNQLTRAERLNNELSQMLPILRNQFEEYCPNSVEVWQQQQFNWVTDAAYKTGIYITSYTDEQEKKKCWGAYRSAQLTMTGTFEQLCGFLVVLKQSPYMIQCNQLRAVRTEGELFTIFCRLKFMMASCQGDQKESLV